MRRLPSGTRSDLVLDVDNGGGRDENIPLRTDQRHDGDGGAKSTHEGQRGFQVFTALRVALELVARFTIGDPCSCEVGWEGIVVRLCA